MGRIKGSKEDIDSEFRRLIQAGLQEALLKDDSEQLERWAADSPTPSLLHELRKSIHPNLAEYIAEFSVWSFFHRLSQWRFPLGMCRQRAPNPCSDKAIHRFRKDELFTRSHLQWR